MNKFHYLNFEICRDKKRIEKELIQAVGFISLSPNVLVNVYGMPNNFDEFKIAGYYFINKDNNELFCLYENERDVDFWNSKQRERFEIGGTSDPGEFIKWLKNFQNFNLR